MFSKIKFKIAKRHIVTITLMIVVFVMSLGYAALSQYMEIQGMAIVQKLWNVSVLEVTQTSTNGGSGLGRFETSQNVVSLQTTLPNLDSTVTYTITFKNSGNVKGILHSIDQIEDKNTNITYSISGITIGSTIAASGTTTATVTVQYKQGATSISTEPKKMMLQFNFVEDTSSSGGSGSGGSSTVTLSSKILADNTAQSDSGIDFSQISSDTNGKGLYYTSTNTENNKPTYYFRGAVENNYVVFGKQTISESGTCTYNGQLVYYDFDDTLVADEEQCVGGGGKYCLYYSEFEETYYMLSCSGMAEPGVTKVNDIPTYIPGNSYEGDMLWRIVRINEDGSIRLITQDTVGYSAFNTNYNDNAYVGYMYGAGSSTYALTHANTNNSTIKGVIDNWYSNNTNLSSLRETHLADAGFCNDRSVASTSGLWYSTDTALGYAKNETYYGAYNRLYTNKKPQFACPNASNDLFTTSTSSKGNKALTVPIGLITADEVWYAGATRGTNKTHYLYADAHYWTMSPFHFDGSYARGWYVLSDGALYRNGVHGSVGVRPVVNLKSTVTLSSTNPSGCSSQNGTASCPYIIATGSSSGTTSYTVSVSSTNTSYGTVSPNSQTVASGSSATFTLSPKSGYAYSSNTCGGTVSGNTMTISNVTANKTCTVTFVATGTTLSSKILSDNTTQSDSGIDFSQISSDTNGKGLYYTSTNTEGNQPTYYFRGAVENNYVKFGNVTETKTTKGMCVYNGEEIKVFDKYQQSITSPTESECLAANVCYNSVQNKYYIDPKLCGKEPGSSLLNEKATYIPGSTSTITNDMYWKIIRINEDGSVRIIYNGTSTTATGANVTIGNSAFNTNSGDNAYVGYMYGATGSSTYAATHANTNNSTIKGVIDNWYSNNTNLSSLRETHLADAGFCNDRSVASTSGLWNSGDTALGYAKNVTHYGAYNRLYTNKKPQFACPNASNDLFTTSTSSKGNKALTNPIGLITADEVWYAGATMGTNKTHYLYTGSLYWTMSPGIFTGSDAYEWYVYSYGYLLDYSVGYDYGVRPVANLQSGVEITGGDGTSGNPYIIK